MPVYLYQCGNCGIQFEKQQKFEDQPLTRCPECGKKALKKVYQPVGIVFKGSGFYITDYRKPSYTEGAKKDSSTPTGTTAAAKTDPAPKTSAVKSGDKGGPSKKD